MTWIGTPFMHRTMIKGVGCDCAMLILAVFSKIGIIPNDVKYEPYTSSWHLHQDEEKYLSYVLKFCTEITKPKIGDIGLWRFGRCFSHGAILTTEYQYSENPFQVKGTVIHALMKNRIVCCDPVNCGQLRSRPVKWFNPYG